MKSACLALRKGRTPTRIGIFGPCHFATKIRQHIGIENRLRHRKHGTGFDFPREFLQFFSEIVRCRIQCYRDGKVTGAIELASR